QSPRSALFQFLRAVVEQVERGGIGADRFSARFEHGFELSRPIRFARLLSNDRNLKRQLCFGATQGAFEARKIVQDVCNARGQLDRTVEFDVRTFGGKYGAAKIDTQMSR